MTKIKNTCSDHLKQMAYGVVQHISDDDRSFLIDENLQEKIGILVDECQEKIELDVSMVLR